MMYAWYDDMTDAIFECGYKNNPGGRFICIVRYPGEVIFYDRNHCVFLGKI